MHPKSKKVRSIFLVFLYVIHLQAPKKAKRRQQGEGGSSNVFSMFEQSQIQEYKEVRLTAQSTSTPFSQIHPHSSYSGIINQTQIKIYLKLSISPNSTL